MTSIRMLTLVGDVEMLAAKTVGGFFFCGVWNLHG